MSSPTEISRDSIKESRRAQSLEQFQHQKDNFWTKSPVVNEDTLLNDYLDKMSLSDGSKTAIQNLDKTQRERIFYGLDRLYYLGNYTLCREKAISLEKSMKLPTDINLNAHKNRNIKHILKEIHIIQAKCNNHIAK